MLVSVFSLHNTFTYLVTTNYLKLKERQRRQADKRKSAHQLEEALVERQ